MRRSVHGAEEAYTESDRLEVGFLPNENGTVAGTPLWHIPKGPCRPTGPVTKGQYVDEPKPRRG